MKSIPCNIVLLPDEELTQHALAVSKSLSKHETWFTLEIGAYYPHLSLYMFQLREADIPKVEQIMAQIAQDYHIMQRSATNYFLGDGFAAGYLDAEYGANEELSSLQNQVIQHINPIRDGMREKDIAKMKDATGLKLENLKLYGYPAVGELFRPHVTLTRLKAHQPEVLTELPDVSVFNGTFDRIGLFEMGDNGTCIREIATFALAA